MPANCGNVRHQEHGERHPDEQGRNFPLSLTSSLKPILRIPLSFIASALARRALCVPPASAERRKQHQVSWWRWATASRSQYAAVSRIVPVLDAGAGVVDTRADVRYVVTEHGVAYLRGKTLRQRAEALISIADPKFRDKLWEFAARVYHVEPRGALAGQEVR